ncbi:MAG: aldolase/citrate lyase family protein [Pseudomonadota bacterium]
MEMPKNLFKQALRDGQAQIGLWCSIAGSDNAEALAGCGFDWMLIDTEHSTVDLTTVKAMLQAAAPYRTQTVVRPGWNDAVEIKRLLDAGAMSVLVPYVQTAAEAARAVSAVRYAPQGTRGVAGITRASRYGAVDGYLARANDEICLLVQVETVEALTNIEAIAAVDGVDGIFVGPADLAASMGFPGNTAAPEVKAAILDAIARIRACGKPAGILSLDPDFLQQAVAAGSVFTAVDVDQAILLRGARALVQQWKG